MKNHEEKSFYDVSSTLVQIDKNISTEEVSETLKGIDFNNVRDKNMLILSQMVSEGETKAVKYLLDHGADPNLESSSYHYYKGPAILFALQNKRSKTEVKLEIINMLIDYGSDINAKAQWFDSNQELAINGNLIEYGLELGMESLKVVNDENFDAESRKSSAKEIEGLQAMLSLLQKSGSIVKPETLKNLKVFLNVEIKNATKADPKKFLEEALSVLSVKDRVYDLPSAAKKVCYKYLENEYFMLSKEWAELIRHLVKISLTFEEVSEYVYDGEIVSFMDDEGWLSQSWEEYNWFDELVDVFFNENVKKNPEWNKLLALMIKECPKYDAESIDEKLANLLKEAWVQSHKSFQELKNIAKQNIPQISIYLD
ncbi:ankyrin repeat domain-containing protein [Flavivirga algicola]|uniref:Ankyrin repeat domain-containing protein n=1 Tax=Flavivirga algicola TaxID=2729136 RepID=A0ABX1RT06_9FLAO|nr:hypothetical protein [Flavivirga algicola]NMH86120.1 hypothetical protein [Flavivirga algicola]